MLGSQFTVSAVWAVQAAMAVAAPLHAQRHSAGGLVDAAGEALNAALGLQWAGTSFEPVNDVGAMQQPSAPRSPVQPHRSLLWGDINVIHTTDTHGWLAGHLLEPQFSADWGDFVSFAQHMRNKAAERGVDLILVDTGDRHDGNGLGDASEVNAQNIYPTFAASEHDVITIGNHELYRGEIALAEYLDSRERYGDRYVVSNVEIWHENSWRPMGYKYRLWVTEATATRVLALGFLFNFDNNDRSSSRVTNAAEEIQKPWFQGLLYNEIADDGVDVILLVGHIPVRGSPEFNIILNAIRSVNKNIPVLMFGGHSHIRDFKIYDDHAAALESGRFLETVGWASLALPDGEERDTLSSAQVDEAAEEPTRLSTSRWRHEIERTYIDFNRHALIFHANVTAKEFDTEEGRKVSGDIADVRRALRLDDRLSCVPETYYTDRAPFPSKNSLFSLIKDHVLPLLRYKRPEAARYVLLNTGGVRFDLFKGLYTRDTGYIVSPFVNEWVTIEDVPITLASRVVPLLNREGKVLGAHSRMSENWSHRDENAGEFDIASWDRKPHTLLRGYRTLDDYGVNGDDTPHIPWQFYPVPNVIQATQNVTGDTTCVDLVFHDFLQPFVLKALSQISDAEFAVKPHGGERLIDLLPTYLDTLDPIEECQG